MIVTEEELERVNAGEQTQLWRPVTRGTLKQRRGAPVREETCVSLQLAPFRKGTKVTIPQKGIVLRTFEPFTKTDARALGHHSVLSATAAWKRSYGPPTPETEVWAIQIILGDHSDIYRDHAEQYLRAKMGGGRDYTPDPKRAIGGERHAGLHAVPAADLAGIVAAVHDRHDEEVAAARESAIADVEKAIATLREHETSLTAEDRAHLRYLTERLERMKTGEKAA